MNFIVSSTDLLKRLSAISNVVPAKAVLPIIQNIHLHLKGDQLELTATDLEITMRTTVRVEPGDSDAPFNVALPTKILLDTLRALPEQPIRFTVSTENNLVTLHSDNGEYKINGLNGADFPVMQALDQAARIQLPLPTLLRAIDRVLFAASTEDLKPAMNGMFFDLKKEAATFVATDAHRLVRYRRFDISVQEEVSFIVPHKALKLLSGAASASGEEVAVLEYNNTNAFFSIGNILMVCRLVDARFPDYENVIPTQSANKLIVNKKELAQAMKRLDIFANKITHLGRFKLEGNLLTIETQDTANEARETLHCLYEGEDMEIGFNLAQMDDLVANVATDDAIVELGSAGRAAVILPSVQEEGEHLLMLLMPVMLSHGYY